MPAGAVRTMLSETQAGNLSPNMRQLFEPAKLELDRAPLLRVVFDRFAALYGEIVRPLRLPQCTFMLEFVQEIASGAIKG